MASGNLLCRWGAAAGQPLAGTTNATLDTRNAMLVLDFDDSVNEYIQFFDVMPPTYGGGGLTVKLRWMATSAVSGTVRWFSNIERIRLGVDDTDVDTSSAGVGASSAAVAPNGTTMQAVFVIPAGALMDNVVVGDYFRFRLIRDGQSATGTDDMAGDAEAVSVEVYET